jgi:GLPGLI family protein
MRIIPFFLCLALCIQVRGQEVSVNVFEYETYHSWPVATPNPITNKITIQQRGTETYEYWEDPYDKSYVPKPRFRYTSTKPYGAFYFDRADSSAVWIRMLDIGDTIRAELKFEPEAWTLLPDTATIEGFFCRKAERYIPFNERVVTAWYTEDLGVSVMPMRYLGLPGVLVKADDRNLKLASVRLAEAGAAEIKPICGKLMTLKKLKAAKSAAQKSENVMPLKADE